MAQEKKPSIPSIYSDRGTIGSTDELDEYGVWVKSEPQDLGSAELSSGSDDSDFIKAEIGDLPDFETLEAEVAGDFTEAGEDEKDDGSTFNFGDFTVPDDTGDISETESVSESDTETEEDDSDVFNFGDFTAQSNLTVADNADQAETEIEESAEELDLPAFEEIEGIEEEIKETEETTEEIEEAIDSFEPPRETPRQGDASSDLSTQLLLRIAEELSSIRTELSVLKKELAGVQSSTPAVKEKEAPYLSDEDDEKIALTGAELINIMNTADFTEETGTDAGIDLSDESTIGETAGETEQSFDMLGDLDIEINLDDSNLDELAGETTLEDSLEMDSSIESIESIEPAEPIESTESIESIELMPDFSTEDTDELRQLREDGAEPMTSPPDPEDEDYLTDDPMGELPEETLATEDLSFDISMDTSPDTSSDVSADIAEESIDFSEAVIDEPDLSSEIQENPLEEPSLEDISISLDLSELESAEPESAELESVEPESLELSSEDEIEDLGLPEIEELIELPLDISSDFDSGEISLPAEPENEPASLETEEFEAEEFETEELNTEELNTEELGTYAGEDLSLIPEAFAVDEEDSHPLVEEAEEELISEEDLEILDAGGETPAEIDEIRGNEDVPARQESSAIPSNLKLELKTVLSYMDQLLESLPDDKIEEFAKSEYYETYKKLFKELGLV